MLLQLVALGLSLPALAAVKLNPRPDGSLGITYSYDSNRSWQFIYTSDISSENLQKAPSALKWSLVRVGREVPIKDQPGQTQTLLPWSPATRGDLQAGSFAVNAGTPLLEFLPEMKAYQLVFADEAGTPVFFFDLGEICTAHPTRIKNLTNPSARACEVAKSDLPSLPKECADKRPYYLELQKKGLLRCGMANDQLAKRGCEPIECK